MSMTDAELRAKPNVCTVGFLVIEVIIGYEWFIRRIKWSGMPFTPSHLEQH